MASQASSPPRSRRFWGLLLGLAALLVVLVVRGLPSLAPIQAQEAPDVPRLTGRVNDHAGLLSPGARQTLEERLAEVERSDSTQIAVLTIDSLKGEDLETYAIRVAQAWGLGRGDVDNGVLLLVVKDDRLMRIEVGQGLEGRLTDLQAGRIVDLVMRPLFQEGLFDQGVRAGVEAIVSSVRGEYRAPGGPGPGEGEGGGLPVIIVAVFILSALRWLPPMVRGVGGAVLLPALAAVLSWPLALVLLMAPLGFVVGLVGPILLGRGGPRGRGGGGGTIFGPPGGFGGGGFGGGGFSGGGGGFSGGGASGRW